MLEKLKALLVMLRAILMILVTTMQSGSVTRLTIIYGVLEVQTAEKKPSSIFKKRKKRYGMH